MKQKLIAFFCLCSILLVGGCAISSAAGEEYGSAELQPEAVVFTVDGHPVTVEEFQIFLRAKRSATAQYFYTAYGAQVTDDFWTTDFDGQTPSEYCKQLALEELLAFKMPLIIAKERELIDDISFASLMTQMNEENEQLAARIAAGEVTYGLTSFDPLQYLLYVSSDCELKLQNDEIARLTDSLSTGELLALYTETLEQYSLGSSAKYERVDLPLSDEEAVALYQTISQFPQCSLQELAAQGVLPDGTAVETVQSDQQEIGKDDFWEQQVLETVLTLPIGQISDPLPTADGITLVYVTERTPLGYAPFDEVKSTVIYYAARQSLADLTQQRIQAAELTMSDTVYHALTPS